MNAIFALNIFKSKCHISAVLFAQQNAAWHLLQFVNFLLHPTYVTAVQEEPSHVVKIMNKLATFPICS